MYQSRRLEMIAARWNAKAQDWDRDLSDPMCHLNEDDAYQRFLLEVQSSIRACHEFCSRHGVVDLGCGTGLVLANVIPSFAWGVGIDISPKMIRLAQSKHVPGARFLVGDAFRFPTLVPKAGAILSRGVLLSHYGVTHAASLLKSARRALAKNGFLILDFLNEAASKLYLHRPENKSFYTSMNVQLLARQAGFVRINILGDERRRVLLLRACAD